MSLKVKFKIRFMNLSSVKKSLISTIVLLFLFSCSVQKRHYSNGYNVSWNNKKQTTINTNNFPIEKREEPSDNNVEASINESVTITKPDNNILINKTAIVNNIEANTLLSKTTFFKKQQLVKNIKDDKPIEKPKYHPYAIISFISGLLALLIFPLLGEVAIFFGKKILRKLNTDQETYKGKSMAKAGLICGWIALLLQLFGLIFILFISSIAFTSVAFVIFLYIVLLLNVISIIANLSNPGY
jgi:hypothetical protein